MSKGRRDLFFAAGVALFLAVTLAQFWRASWSNDVVMYASAGDEILAGARPYVDLIDINPPLIMGIHLIFSWVGKVIGVDSLRLFLAAVLSGVLASAFTVYSAFRDKERVWTAGLTALLPSWHALFTTQFGQREHLFMLAFLPYLSLRWAGRSGRWARLVFALTAVLALLKLEFFFLLAVFELLLFRKTRARDTRHRVMLIMPLGIYLAQFLLWPAPMRSAFWGELVPLVLRYYRGMGISLPELYWVWATAFFTYLPLAVGYILCGSRRDSPLLASGVLALIGFGSAVLRQKGWEYHLLPAQFSLAFGFPFFAERLGQLIPGKPTRRSISTLAGIAALAYSIQAAQRFSVWPKLYREKFAYAELNELGKPGETVLLFHPHLSFVFPLFRQAGFRLATRYVFLFPVAFFRSRWTAEKFGPDAVFPEEERFIRNLREDIARRKPDLVVFPGTAAFRWWVMPPEFDYLDYAERNGIFSSRDPAYALVLKNAKLTVFRRKAQ